MAILRKSLLGLSATCFVAGGALSQDGDPKELVKQAWRHVMLGEKAKAIPVLEQVLAMDPSQEDAFKLWQAVEKDIWQELILSKGEVSKIAKHIMQKANSGRRAISRDASEIDPLVAQALEQDYGVRHPALSALKAKHGEFAVPGFLEKLGDHDDDRGSLYAMAAMRELGSSATLALIECLQSKNPTLRRNIAAVFGQTRDFRSIPALTALLKDTNEGVVVTAKGALREMGASETADPVDLFQKQSQDFLVGIGTQGQYNSEVVWSFADGKLSYKDCDAAVYTFELAKKAAEHALALDPTNDQAKTLIARSYLAQCSAISGQNIESLADTKDGLKRVAMALGPKVLGAALQESLRDRQPFVAVAAIEALGESIDRDGIAGSPLMAALDSTNKTVAYAAALAITKASGANNVPEAGKVVAVLARGVGEQSLIRVATVGFSGANKEAIGAIPDDKAGVVVEANFDNARDLIDQVLVGAIRPDAVVVNNTLPNAIPMDIIGIFGDNDRTKAIKILVAGGAEGVYEGKGDSVKIIDASFKAEDVRATVLEVVKDSIPAAQKRANDVAAQTSAALRQLATNRVDISGAVDGISAALTREDSVAIPVADSIGEGGSSIDALVTALGGAGSDELKVACANAAGKILGRIGTITDEQFAALKAIAVNGEAEAGLRTAVSGALGKATLTPAQQLELVKALSTSAVSN